VDLVSTMDGACTTSLLKGLAFDNRSKSDKVLRIVLYSTALWSGLVWRNSVQYSSTAYYSRAEYGRV
jgi:hypothetical protein